ncbi:thioesterase, partial [Acidimicrobiaceae bacterium USS-CC1]|nr:thioesterase [Acidiferrimicrobium australe]
MSVKQAMSGAAELVVAWEDTAAAARSGDVAVLATPRVVA